MNNDDEATRHLCERVRQLRKQRGWTLEELATESGVSRSMLSQIERGEANPTFKVAYRIAEVFGMSLGELADPPTQSRAIDVIRADDDVYHFEVDEYSLRTLYPKHLEKNVEFYELKLRPGHDLKSAPHLDGTMEFITVQEGEIEITSGDQSSRLGAGDSAHYPADVPHSIQNVGDGEAVAFLVAVYKGD